MKLERPFYRLPSRFDVARLQAEIAQFDESDWQRHPSGYNGNSAIRLISAEGGENDLTVGRMAASAALARCPYIRQVLEYFGVVWSRSRLMRLAPGAVVPEHADINYHWYHRVRIHIPVTTSPGVRFHCDDQTVHMAQGEAWVFDNWRRHSVENDSDIHRVHLVADTSGSAAFWESVTAAGQIDLAAPLASAAPLLAFRPDHEARLRFEQHNSAIVIPPAEIEALAGDLLGDLTAPATSVSAQQKHVFSVLLQGFCREWRLVWSLHADTAEGWPHYARLRDYLLTETQALTTVSCASNGMNAAEVLHARVLLYALNPQGRSAEADRDRTLGPAIIGNAQPPRIERPIFIVAAPRSGSTLLFETLAQARDLVTVGGEAHWLVEGLPQLRPGAPGIESNRLTASQYAPVIADQIKAAFYEQLRDRDCQPVSANTLRVLEKTPKNALRVPFFDKIFPDARYIFLWREPQENLSSIIEAWRAGDWITYRDLPGRKGPWSLLLPPGWQALHDAPLEDIAAFQWIETNRTVLDDLAALPPERWISLSYAAFLADPAAQTRRLCDFAGIEFDTRLATRCGGTLPLSVHTHTPPASGKWKRNEALLARVLPQTDAVHARLRALGR